MTKDFLQHSITTIVTALFRKKCLYNWIFVVVTLTNGVISVMSQMNETNTTTTATPNSNSTTTSSPPGPFLPTPPQPPSCIDKKVWNVCWLKTVPYIFDRPNNKSRVEGILADAIIKGLTKCQCEVNLNYTLQVYEEEDLVNCSKNKNIDLVLPFPEREVTHYDWFFKVVDSPAIYLLSNRKRIQSQAKANIIYEFSQVWTLAVFTILLAAIFGVIVWSLDSAWNRKQFPPTFCPGAIEGVWWSFVTLTTVGYGDKTPKFPLARIFAIIWMFVGMCMVSLLTATLTKALTTGLVENRREFHGLEIGVLKNSHTYHEAVKKGAQTKKFRDLQTMYTALNENEIQGILIDVFVATYVRNNLDVFGFKDNIFVAQSYDIQYSIGVYFGGGVGQYVTSNSFKWLKQCLKSLFENSSGRLGVFSIVEKYIQPRKVVEKSKVYDEFKIEINLFSPTSEIFTEGLKALCGILGILVFFGIIWEIVRCRWKKTKNLPRINNQEPNGDSIAMSGHQRMTTESIQKLVSKLDEVERALRTVTEFRKLYEQCKKDIQRYDSGISNGNPHNGNGTPNIGYCNNA